MSAEFTASESCCDWCGATDGRHCCRFYCKPRRRSRTIWFLACKDAHRDAFLGHWNMELTIHDPDALHFVMPIPDDPMIGEPLAQAALTRSEMIARIFE